MKLNTHQSKIIKGLTAFQQHLEDWNQLWDRSGSHVGLHRAQALTHYVEAFANPADLRVVVALENGAWVSGIPLLRRKNRLGQWIGQSLSNEWSVQDCVLHDPSYSPERFRALEEGFRESGFSSVKLPWLPLSWCSSEALIAGWKSRGRQVSVRPKFWGGQLNLPEDWSAYWTGLSRNRRKKLQKGLTELSKLGPVELEVFSGDDLDLAHSMVESALQIELASWKGDTYTAVLSHPQIAEFFRRNCRHFAESGILRVHLLKVAGRAIAFDLGYVVRGIYTSYKISYLKEFAEFSPGQLLTMKMIEHLYASGDAEAIDFLGPLSAASEAWANSRYPVGQVNFSGGSMINDLSVFAWGKFFEWARPNPEFSQGWG